jgi:tetratricopeptide (TPR) repeat protein
VLTSSITWSRRVAPEPGAGSVTAICPIKLRLLVQITAPLSTALIKIEQEKMSFSKEFDDVVTQPPFVGKSRMLVVDGLISIFDDMSHHQESRLISLEAPSGWGKTRVAQEFYARLAARQKYPYWPKTILEASDAENLDVASRRKRIFSKPDYCNPDIENFPEFMWWGIACDMRNGVPSQVLLEDLKQIATHSLYLKATRFTLKAIKGKNITSMASAKEICNSLVDEVAGLTLSESLQLLADSVPVVGIGSTVKLVRWGIDKFKESNELKTKMKAGNLFAGEEKNDDLIQTAMNLVGNMARTGIPTIVFIEDYHKATPITEELVERMIRTDTRIFIITTTWPKEIECKKRMSKLIQEENLKSRIIRIRHDADVPAVFPKGASINELSEQAFEEIILSYYPKADKKTLKLLAARYNNPLPLELVCTLKKYQDAFSDGALKLTEKEVEALPKRVENLYRELWNELPEIIQKALSLSTLAIPDNETSWHSNLIQRSLEQSTSIKDFEALAQSFDRDQIPHGWVRTIEGWLRRFSEPDQWAVAQGYLNDYFFQDSIDVYLENLSEELKTITFNDQDMESQYFARLILALHQKGKMQDIYVLKAIRYLQEALVDLPMELPILIQLGEDLKKLNIDKNSIEMLKGLMAHSIALLNSGQIESALKESTPLLENQTRILGPKHPDTLKNRNNIAYLLGSLGQLKPALEAYNSLLEDQTRILGSDHQILLITRLNLAYFLGQSGQIESALEACSSLLKDQTRILGPDHLDILGTRRVLVRLLGKSGQIESALEECASLLKDQTRILKTDHPSTMLTHSSMANLLIQSGQIESALETFISLLENQSQILGPEHPNTLITRGNMALALVESGRIDSAMEAHTSLLEDKARILGPDHPSTLATRSNLANLLGKSGQLESALDAFTSLQKDQTQILGPEHPDTLIIRQNRSYFLGQSGKIESALEECNSLLKDQTRILGPDHPDTLTTRSTLANLLGDSGQIESALEACNALLEDQTRILGPEHPDTLTTRNDIACFLGSSGRIESALEAFTSLLEDRTQILGPDHPDTLKTRNELAHDLGKSGQIESALDAFTSLLKDQTRILGLDHPDKLNTRSNLAYFLGGSGQIKSALETYNSLLEDQIRIIGPDHPDTLTTRNNIACLLGDSRQIESALEAYTSLLKDRIRILGPEHPNTLITRSNLAFFLGESGQIESALKESASLLEDQTRILGPEHPDTLTTRNDIAHLYSRSGKIESALEVFTSLMEDQTQILGPKHPDTLDTHSNLVYFLRESGQIESALQECTSLLKNQTQILGPENPNTLITSSNLANLLGESGQIESALEALNSLLKDQTRILGPEHPDTLVTHDCIAHYMDQP